jgi:hypothetical protein
MSEALMFAGNPKVQEIISELFKVNDFGNTLLKEAIDGKSQATLCFSPILWSRDIDNITRSIADLLQCESTLYSRDRALDRIIVTFQK